MSSAAKSSEQKFSNEMVWPKKYGESHFCLRNFLNFIP